MAGVTRRELGALGLALGTQLRGAQSIDETLRSGIARRGIPAAVGMAATGKRTLYEGAFGTRDSSGAPVRIDSIFHIASMTKAVTTVAAMQLVETGKVRLDEPVSKYLPKLADLDVLAGLDANGQPILHPVKTPVTLKHLLTHTSGFSYDNWDEGMYRYTTRPNAQPDAKPGPLMFEPGTRWQYGQGLDWAGRLVEAVSGMNLEEYFQTRILGPLEMRDTSFNVPPAKFDRLVANYHRDATGNLMEEPRTQPAPAKEYNGGGGLRSTAGDYTRFMQMILGKGMGLSGARILLARTVESMEANQIGNLTAGKMKSFRLTVSSDVDIQPGSPEKWGLGFLINPTPYSGGRSAGSLAWAGIYNTFYWIDVKRSLCGVLMMQFLPFVDREAVGLLGDFERAVYSSF